MDQVIRSHGSLDQEKLRKVIESILSDRYKATVTAAFASAHASSDGDGAPRTDQSKGSGGR